MSDMEFGFHGCLEASAFEVILNEEDVQFRKEGMDSLEEKGLDNTEAFEVIFYIPEGVKLTEEAENVFDNYYNDCELENIIKRPSKSASMSL